jgi:4-amino-4-deoxy-L-arabinose transferase-like glycosyltransferase
LLLAATIAAIIEDFRRREARDFWHWLGLAVFFGAPVHLAVTVWIEGAGF